MNPNVQQAYNAIAMLVPEKAADIEIPLQYAFEPMDLHMLRSTVWRIEVLLGNIEPEDGTDLSAAAYMAGYEDADK